MNHKIVNLSDLPYQELQSSRTGEKYSFSANLSSLLDLKDVFIHHEVIPPSRRSSGPHAHSHREEAIFVLEGSVTAYLDGQAHILKAGDSMAFLPGEKNIHFLQNHTQTSARVLVVASNPANDKVIYDE